MSLMSPALVVVLVALVLAMVVGTILLWPRLAPTRALTVLGRLGLLLGTNVAVLLLAFALLNDTFQFFSDWSDLIGTASTQTTTAAGGGQASGAVAVSVAPPAAVPVSTATVLHHANGGVVYQVTGAVSGVSASVLVDLPQGYGDPANSSRRYPVLVGMAGYPAPVTQLSSLYPVVATEQALQQSHELGPVINVYPHAWTPSSRDTECVDGPDGAVPADRLETWLTVDVPAWVRATFRANPQRSAWATWGESAGGWCASMMTMLHPDTFSAAISLGGYFRPSWGNWVPYPPGDPALARYDLVDLAHRAPPPVALWLFAGRGDSYAFPSTDQLIAAARPPLSVTAQIASSGGHRISEWKPWLPVALRWLGHNVSGFAPAP